MGLPSQAEIFGLYPTPLPGGHFRWLVFRIFLECSPEGQPERRPERRKTTDRRRGKIFSSTPWDPQTCSRLEIEEEIRSPKWNARPPQAHGQANVGWGSVTEGEPPLLPLLTVSASAGRSHSLCGHPSKLEAQRHPKPSPALDLGFPPLLLDLWFLTSLCFCFTLCSSFSVSNSELPCLFVSVSIV